MTDQQMQDLDPNVLVVVAFSTYIEVMSLGEYATELRRLSADQRILPMLLSRFKEV